MRDCVNALMCEWLSSILAEFFHDSADALVNGIAGEGETGGGGEAVGDFLRVVALETELHKLLLVGREEREEVEEGVGEVEAGDGEGVGQLVGEGFRLGLLTAVEVEDDGLGELFEPAALPCLGGGEVELVELEPEDYPDFLCQVLGAGLAVVAVAASAAGIAPADTPHRGAVAAHEGAVGVVPGGVGCHHFFLFIVGGFSGTISKPCPSINIYVIFEANLT